MKNLKSVIVGLAVLVSVGMTAQSQEVKKQDKVQKLTEQLGLTAEQEAEVTLIFQEAKKDRQVLKSNESLTPEAKKKESKELRKKTDAKMQSVLKKEQYSKYTEMKSKKRDARKLGKTDKHEAMNERLGLDENQKADMKTLNEKIMVLKKSIKADASLTEDEKRAALTELRIKRDEGTRAILTEEQYKQLKEMKKDQRGAKGKGMSKERKQK